VGISDCIRRLVFAVAAVTMEIDESGISLRTAVGAEAMGSPLTEAFISCHQCRGAFDTSIIMTSAGDAGVSSRHADTIPTSLPCSNRNG
jgi:hypothetical protein